MNKVMAGVDRMVIYDIDLDEFYKSKIEKEFILKEEGENGFYRIAKDNYGKDFNLYYMKISRNQGCNRFFTELKVGSTMGNGKRIVHYENMDINPSKSLSVDGINLNNVSTIKEFNNFLGMLEKYLKRYICKKVNFSNAKIKKLETNVNVWLNNPFSDYERVFEFCREIFQKRMKKEINSPYFPNDIYTGFKIGNGSNKIKFYDKRAQILSENEIDIKEEILRIEYTDENETKIKDYLGHNNITGLITDFSHLDKSFKKRLKKDLIDRIQKNIQCQIKDTIKMLKHYKAINRKSSIDEYIKNYKIFDIEIVLAALKEVENSKNYSRECKKAINSALAVEKEKLFGNINLLNEILEKLRYPKIEINMTEGIESLVQKYY